MKNNAKVTHLNLNTVVQPQGGQQLKRNLFDGFEGLPGVTMQLCPIGVVCKHAGRRFIIPFHAINAITIDPNEAE